MSLFDRLLGRRPSGEAGRGGDAAPADPAMTEEERDRAVLREEAERLDELQQRQLRYAQYAWTPEPQGGPRRSDDEEAEER